MKILNITWQHLITDERGQTCPRCGSTEQELDKAVSMLRQALSPLGIEVVLDKKVVTQEVFTRDALASNRIWINDRPLEEWLGADVGHSLCCDVCGDAECRTVEVEGEIYEAIPSDVIIRAGLVAASGMVSATPSEISCKDDSLEKMPAGGCCPIQKP